MQIQRNEKREVEIFNRIRESFIKKDKERNNNIKLSDLLRPRQAFYQKMFPMPPTDLEINYWVIGRGHEDVMHRVAELNKPESKIWNGIYYGIDFQIDNIPIEMKTRRGYLAKDGEEIKKYESYIEQLIGYCACESILNGELWVWSLLEKTDSFRSAPKMVCYNVDFSQEEIDIEQKRLLYTKEQLIKALAGDVKALEDFPSCPEWQCFRKETNMLTPPKCKTCDREFKTEFGIDSHVNSKTGKGHEVTHATYDIKFIPTCKWYTLCRK